MVTVGVVRLVAVAAAMVPVSNVGYTAAAAGNPSDTWSTGALAAPGSLACVWAGTNSLTSWTNTSGGLAGGYSIERSNSSGSGYSVVTSTSGPSSTTATDTNPAPPTLRYYRVATTQQLWISPYTTVAVSSTCEGTITSLFAPGTVTGPLGIAVDTNGDVYTSDTDSNRVVKTTTAGVTTTFAGTGVAGFSDDGGVATAAKQSAPTAWRSTRAATSTLPTTTTI